MGWNHQKKLQLPAAAIGANSNDKSQVGSAVKTFMYHNKRNSEVVADSDAYERNRRVIEKRSHLNII